MSFTPLGERLRARPRKRFSSGERPLLDEPATTVVASLQPAQIHQRYLDYLIGVRFARGEEQLASDDLPANAASKKLAMDQRRHTLEKMQQERVVALQKTLRTRLSANLRQQVIARLADPDQLLKKVLQPSDNLIAALSLLRQEGKYLTRLELLLKNESWLARELLSLVNSPAFQEYAQRDEPVDSFAEAMLVVGQDRLLMLISGYCVKALLPNQQKLAPLLERKLWEHCNATANLAWQLAQWQQLPPSLAYQLGVFHELGHICLLRLLDGLYRENLDLHLHKARVDGNAPLHEALRTLPPPTDLHRQLMAEFAAPLSVSLLQVMGWLHPGQLSPLREVGTDIPASVRSPMARLLWQANAYAEYRALNEARLITPEQAQALFSELAIPEWQLEQLGRLNLRKLHLGDR